MTTFESLLLDRPVARVEPFGEPEPSFIGGGRVGAGGTPDGAWDYLIGPTYSSPNFLHEERLSVGWHGGRNRSVAPAMHRVAGSGLLCGRQCVGDLEVEVWEVAPWDGQDVLRIVALANRGSASLRRTRVQAFVRAPGKPAIQDQALVISLPQGSPSYGGECPSWAERTARIAWNRPASLCGDSRDNVGTGLLLTCELGDLAPGATVVAALVHRLDEGAGLPALDLPADPAGLVKRELAAWQEWFGRGIAAARGDALVESQLAFIRMQQSFDGGFIAGVRRYAYSYIRDMHGACRGLLAAGHADEAARAMAWIDRKVRHFGTVVNASEMGADVRDFVGGHKGTELPAYFLLLAASLLRHGRAEAVDACRASLVQAADEQIAVSRADGWRFHYNGDETERYVPVVDGANYLFGKPDWSKGRACWSMPSHVLAMASVETFARVLAARWGLDAAPYLAAVESWRASFAPTFQPDGRAVPAWTVFADGSLPSYPVPNYLLFAAWVDAPFAPEQVRAWVEAAEACLDPVRGRVPVCPGAVEGSCGHDLALLLYGLKRIGAAPERIRRIEVLIRNGGSLQWFGMVNEFYGPDGTPNQHNLRPFETGPLTEALVRYIR
jgi:hypothetical protein